MLFRSFGPAEIGLIILLVIVLFGVGKLAKGLPQLGKGMGQAVGEFRNSVKNGKDTKGEAETKSTDTEDTSDTPEVATNQHKSATISTRSRNSRKKSSRSRTR